MALGFLLKSWYVLFNRVKEKSGTGFFGDWLRLWQMTQIIEMCN